MTMTRGSMLLLLLSGQAALAAARPSAGAAPCHDYACRQANPGFDFQPPDAAPLPDPLLVRPPRSLGVQLC